MKTIKKVFSNQTEYNWKDCFHRFPFKYLVTGNKVKTREMKTENGKYFLKVNSPKPTWFVSDFCLKILGWTKEIVLIRTVIQIKRWYPSLG